MLAFLPILAAVPPLGLRGATERPSLSGEVRQVDLEGFRFHYTTTGRDTVPPADRDGNGTPDVIEEMADALAFGRQAFADEGWRPVLPDDGGGGTDAIDVYLILLDINGFARPVPSATGEGASCLIALDPTTPTGGGVLRSVAVHELHHCIQFHYVTGLPSWLYESASTYEQYSHVTSAALDLALGVLYADELSTPDRALTSEAPPNDPYTTFLFTKFWTEFQASEPVLDRLPALWEALGATDGGWRSRLDRASEDTFGLPLEVVFLMYATYNRFTCGADDGRHYAPEPLPCVANTVVPVEPLTVGEPVDVAHREGPFTAHYLELVAPERGWYDLACVGDDVVTSWMSVADGGVDHGAVGLAQADVPRIWLEAGDEGQAVIVGTRGRLDARCDASIVTVERAGCSTGGTPSIGAFVALLLALGRRLRPRRQREPEPY